MRRVWPWLRLLIGLFLLAIPVWRLGPDAFIAGFRTIDVTAVFWALGIGGATTVLCAGRWCLVARRLGLRLPLGTAVADYYRAVFLNSVLPVGVLGDADRAVRHGRQEGDLGRGIRGVVFERLGGQVVLMVVAVALLVTYPPSLFVIPDGVVSSLVVAIAALAGLAAVLALATWIWRRSRAALITAWADVRLGLLAREVWPGVLLLSTAALAGHLALFLVAARIAGSSAPVAQLLPLLVLALLAMGLPFNVGGWGPREAFAASAFGAAGLGAAHGLTVAVTYGVLVLIASLPGVAMLAFRRSPVLGVRRRGVGARPEVGARPGPA